MEIITWILLATAAAFISLIISLVFSNILNYWFSTLLSRFSFLKTDSNISGIWKAEFIYKEDIYVEFIRLKKIFGIVIGNIVPNNSNYEELQAVHFKKPFRLTGQLYKGIILTGTWKDPKKDFGFHGAFQLILNESSDKIEGKWIGYNSKRIKVNLGDWSLKKYIPKKTFFTAIYGVSGAGKTTLAKQLAEKLDFEYMSEAQSILSYYSRTNYGSNDLVKFKDLRESKRQKIRNQGLKEGLILNSDSEKSIIVDCHYSFTKNNLGKRLINYSSFKRVMPKICEKYYAVVLYLITPVETISKRVNPNEIKYRTNDIQELKTWQDYERKKLSELCKKNKLIYIEIKEDNLTEVIEIIEKTRHNILYK